MLPALFRRRAEERAAALKRERQEAVQSKVLAQIAELKQQEEEAELLKKAERQLELDRARLFEEESRRAREARARQMVRYSRSLRRQYKDQLLRKARQIQDDLEADLRLLDDLRVAEEADQARQTARWVTCDRV